MKLLTKIKELLPVVEEVKPLMEKMTYTDYKKVDMKKIRAMCDEIDSLECRSEMYEYGTLVATCPEDEAVGAFLLRAKSNAIAEEIAMSNCIVEIVKIAIELKWLLPQHIEQLTKLTTNQDSKNVGQRN
jgi:hypothetical protein